jgi:hypothetical protein
LEAWPLAGALVLPVGYFSCAGLLAVLRSMIRLTFKPQVGRWGRQRFTCAGAARWCGMRDIDETDLFRDRPPYPTLHHCLGDA